jgi:hypothetical protein
MSPLQEHILKNVLCREDSVGAIASINSRMLRRASTAQIEDNQSANNHGFAATPRLARAAQVKSRHAARIGATGSALTARVVFLRVGWEPWFADNIQGLVFNR